MDKEHPITKLRLHMLQQSLTGRALADLANIPRPQVSEYACGSRQPGPTHRQRLSEALGVSESELFEPLGPNAAAAAARERMVAYLQTAEGALVTERLLRAALGI